MRRTLPYTSQSALAAFIKYAQEYDITDLNTSRASVYRSREAALEHTEYGPLLISAPMVPCPGKADGTLHMVNPFAYLQLAFKHPGGFHDMVKNALQN